MTSKHCLLRWCINARVQTNWPHSLSICKGRIPCRVMSTTEVWEGIGTKYKIHKETLAYYRAKEESGSGVFYGTSPEKARLLHKANAIKYSGTVDFEGNVNEYVVPSPATSDGLPVSVYVPAACTSTSAILVFFHGGGLVLGSRACSDTMCKIISRDSSCIIVNADYRLCPEHRLPAPIDDAQCVVRWAVMNKAVIGGGNSSKIGVAGASAGGQLAASVTHDIKGIDFQILIYPVCDMRCLEPSYKEFSMCPGVNQAVLDWFFKLSLKNNEQKEDPKMSPLLRPSFQHLPPALFILAEIDPIRDSGYAYRDKLDSAGVATECVLIQGAPHGFFNLPGHFKELCTQAYKPVVKFIKIFNQP